MPAVLFILAASFLFVNFMMFTFLYCMGFFSEDGLIKLSILKRIFNENEK